MEKLIKEARENPVSYTLAGLVLACSLAVGAGILYNGSCSLKPTRENNCNSLMYLGNEKICFDYLEDITPSFDKDNDFYFRC